LHILCIEDNPADAELVVRLTNGLHHHGTFVETLDEARKILESLSPNLILVDVILHQARVGDQFVRDLRAKGYTQPIIAVTALALRDDIQKFQEAGFTEVLTKPYEIAQLAALIAKYQ
jgi:CheY-like chemotaxis protein